MHVILCLDKEQDDTFEDAGKWLTNRTIFHMAEKDEQNKEVSFLPRSGGIVKGRVSTNQPPRSWSRVAVLVLYLWT